ncbi:DUF6609 family protein [Enterococcus sp. BWT-B8]|uniref:DUF6609 family protein n=1 Tax=Enterococcus sp. BWT-B8 TaxID=2885157 RepID=UPI002B4BD241|nr:DUF6609 family protein [Enterococcus sp. BWT-B8]
MYFREIAFLEKNWRMMWLGIFLAIGGHFSFYFVHGISMIGIALLYSVIVIWSMVYSTNLFIPLC